jgi:hypothetical protein
MLEQRRSPAHPIEAQPPEICLMVVAQREQRRDQMNHIDHLRPALGRGDLSGLAQRTSRRRRTNQRRARIGHCSARPLFDHHRVGTHPLINLLQIHPFPNEANVISWTMGSAWRR